MTEGVAIPDWGMIQCNRMSQLNQLFCILRGGVKFPTGGDGGASLLSP